MVEAINNNNNSTGVYGNLAVAAAATAGAAGGAVYGLNRTPKVLSKKIDGLINDVIDLKKAEKLAEGSPEKSTIDFIKAGFKELVEAPNENTKEAPLLEKIYTSVEKAMTKLDQKKYIIDEAISASENPEEITMVLEEKGILKNIPEEKLGTAFNKLTNKALVRTSAMWAAGGAAVLGGVAVGVNYLINRSKKSESSQEA